MPSGESTSRTPRKTKRPSKASLAARERAGRAALIPLAPVADEATASLDGGGSPADGRASRTSITCDGLEFDSSILDRFSPEDIVTEGLRVLSKEELLSLSFEQHAVRQGLISDEIDAVTAWFKRSIRDARDLLDMESSDWSENLVARTRSMLGSVTDRMLYWTACYLEICSSTMDTDAKLKIIAMRDTCESERQIWTKAIDQAVQKANAPPEESESEESDSDESLPEVTLPKETPKTTRQRRDSRESRHAIQALQDQLRLAQAELEEARKLNRERLLNQQLVASSNRWAAMIVPTEPRARVQSPVVTPPRVRRALVPVPITKRATGLTPKPERAVEGLDPRQSELRDFVASSRAVRERREAALDDWIDLYCAGLLDSQAKGSSRPPSVRRIPMYSGRVLDWLEWIALFRTSVHDVEPSVSARAGALRASLDPALVRECMTQSATEDGYMRSLMALKKKCGDRTILRISLTTLLLGLEPSAKAPGGRTGYAAEVKTRLRDLADIGCADGSILERLLSKLTETERLGWRMYSANGRDDIEHYGVWLQLQFEAGVDKYALGEREAREYLHRESSRASIKPSSRRTSSRSPERESRGRVYAVQGESEKPRGAPKKKQQSSSQTSTEYKATCAFCAQGHLTFKCRKWVGASLPERWKMVRAAHLCANCLRPGHVAPKCDRFGPCKIDGCAEMHNRQLHPKATGEPSASSVTALAVGDANGFVMRGQKVTVSLGFLSLKCRDKSGGWRSLTVLVDEGADRSLIRKATAKQLKWTRRENTVLTIRGVGNVVTEEPAHCGELTFLDENEVEVPATVTSMTDPVGKIPERDWGSMKHKWSHLADLPLTRVGGQVDMILGLDNYDLIRGREIRSGEADGEPVATRSKLGWFVRGPIGEPDACGAARGNVVVSHTLEGMFRQFTQTESYGAELKAAPGFSAAEQKAVDMVTEGYVKLTEGVQVPVLYDEPLPSDGDTMGWALRNYRQSQRRRRLDPIYAVSYAKSINKYFEKGYARKVPLSELGGDQYFHPHFGVTKPGEPDKVRVVFDAARVFRGRSMNDRLLSGPTLQTQLPHVLMRFRKNPFAVTADIEAMFSRVRVSDSDARRQRFFWGATPEQEPEVYEMTRLMFGMKCSPFLAIWATRRAAKDSGVPGALEVVERNLYVDDYLDSRRTEAEAEQAASAAVRGLAYGDFPLVGFRSNSARLAASLTGANEGKALETVDMPTGASPPGSAAVPSDGDLSSHKLGAMISLGESDQMQRVLGVIWNPETDNLGFRVTVPESIPDTRRSQLSAVASWYDPLGLASPLIVQAKIALREVCRLSWDQVVPDEKLAWWRSWFERIRKVADWGVPRCLLPGDEEPTDVQLHIFCDASTEAFAAAAYLRSVQADGKVITRLVMARTRLATVSTTICRLELQAAVLGVRLGAYVDEGLGIPGLKHVYWTDSAVVPCWIRADSSYYQQFVAHRIAEVRLATDDRRVWRFVPGLLNPADLATRQAVDESRIPLWFDGAEFLSLPEDSWPADLPYVRPSSELKPCKVDVVTSSAHVCESTCDPSVRRVMTAVNEEPMTDFDPSDLVSFTVMTGRLAELCRAAQEAWWPDECAALRADPPRELRRGSCLLPFTPFIDETGLMRLGGRADRAPDLNYAARHPVLLHRRMVLARAIAKAWHIRLKHVGTDTLLSETRRTVWIVRGRELMKSIRKACDHCAKRTVRPAVPRMGELPPERLMAYRPVFSDVSIDFFGPLDWRLMRPLGSDHRDPQTRKRYVLLVTCLATRAVHLDYTVSESAAEFLNVFRRFCAIYGTPTLVRSDNGSAFLKADKTLRLSGEDVPDWEPFDNEWVVEVGNHMQKEGIEWRFQPPFTPHFGGAHESLVKVAKSCLAQTFSHCPTSCQDPSDRMLQTFLAEAAWLMNSRPLFSPSNDPEDPPPVTPNDLLGRKTNGFQLIEQQWVDDPRPETRDVDFWADHPHLRFKFQHHASKVFWDCWLKRYVPTLIARRKWYTAKNPIKLGDIVMIHVNGVSRGRWPLGTVIKINPGVDGQVRSATVKTIGGEFERGVAKLCVLPAGTRLDEEGRLESPFSSKEIHYPRKRVDVSRGERGKAKSVQQTTESAGSSPAPESPAAGDGRRRLRARRARPAEAAPDWSDDDGPRSPSSGESGPEADDWRPGKSHD